MERRRILLAVFVLSLLALSSGLDSSAAMPAHDHARRQPNAEVNSRGRPLLPTRWKPSDSCHESAGQRAGVE